MGRTRKIPMAKRETAEQRSVTFTKRRQGLFNKAADLCRICDAQTAIVVTSAGSKEKVYIFGHSSVDAVFDRFLGNFPTSPGAADASIKSASNSIHEEIKALEGDVKTLMQNKKRNVEGISWDSFEELVQSSTSVQELQEIVESMESWLCQAKNKLMNNPTGNLGILSNVVESKSDEFLALDFKPHDGSSSSLGDDQISQNSSAIVEYNSSNDPDAYWTTDGSPNSDSGNFPCEFTLDDIWNLIECSDFCVDSEAVYISDNNSNESPTSVTTTSESASGSHENGDSVLLYSEAVCTTEAADQNGDSLFSTTEAADYGFMDLLSEDDYCMTDGMGLPLVMADWTAGLV